MKFCTKMIPPKKGNKIRIAGNSGKWWCQRFWGIGLVLWQTDQIYATYLSVRTIEVPSTCFVICYSAFLQISMQVSWKHDISQDVLFGFVKISQFRKPCYTTCRFWLRRINRSGVQWNFHCHLEWVVVMEQGSFLGTKLVRCWCCWILLQGL